MNKKKLMAIALAVCLIAILSFSTLAWFTDKDQVTNTFTVGSIEIEQHEQQYGENGVLEPFVNNKVLLPVVKENPAEDPNYQDKIVTVENVGNNPAYVQTHIAFPSSLNGYLNLDLNTGSGWEQINSSFVEIGGMDYTVFTYRYNPILEVGVETPVLLNGVYLYAEVDMKEAADGSLQLCKWDSDLKDWSFSGFVVRAAGSIEYNTVDVLVTTQAVQSEGFGTAQEALSAAFGNSTPWG